MSKKTGQAKKDNVRGRNWCFTLNNYTDEEIKFITEYVFKYLIFGCEVAPTTNTPHLQGYFELKDAKTSSALKKIFPRMHIEQAKGSREDNKKYCSKGGGNIVEKGDLEKKQGRRTDLKGVKDAVKAGANMKDVFDMSNSYQAIKMAEIGMKLFSKPRDKKPFVEWCWGPSGAGKSEYARARLGTDAWWSGRNLRWWEGYDGHKKVVIDDFRADFCGFAELLRVLDKYPYTVETKGGSRQLVAEHIIITSAFPPDRVYNTQEDVYQLIRRIDAVYEFVAPTQDVTQKLAAISKVISWPDHELNPSCAIVGADCTEVGGNTSPTDLPRPSCKIEDNIDDTRETIIYGHIKSPEDKRDIVYEEKINANALRIIKELADEMMDLKF